MRFTPLWTRPRLIKLLTQRSGMARQVVALLAAGLAFRLLALPFAMVTEADAVARIFQAKIWLSKPELISHGVWGPLHTYLIAAVLLLHDDTVVSPVLLNIVFSVAAAIPLFLFVKREWSGVAGLLVTCIYLFCPLVIRNSLMATSEVPFTFFVVVTLLALSHARRGRNDWQAALVGGMSLTLAGALRYEAWVLIPLMGALLWRKWKVLSLFLLSSSLFPLYWMMGNYLYYGDALYSIHAAREWQVNVSGMNDNLTTVDVLGRISYYPRVLFFGITPLVALFCIRGMIFVACRRGRQWVWLVPLVGLAVVFTLKALDGSLLQRARYGLELVVLVLPFAGESVERLRTWRRGRAITLIIIASMLPFSYLHDVVPGHPNPIPEDVRAIPRVKTQTARVSRFATKQGAANPGGLVLDFFGFEDTYYVALMSRKNPSQIFVMPGEKHLALDQRQLREFLDHNGTGVVVLTEKSPHMQIRHTDQGDRLDFVGFQTSLSVEELGRVDGMLFLRYANAQVL